MYQHICKSSWNAPIRTRSASFSPEPILQMKSSRFRPNLIDIPTLHEDKNHLAVRSNTTGLPDRLKAGVETLSGYSLDDVKVHFNSSKPAQIQALAYTQGTDIHVSPGQEKHLAHEAWHVVQQKQGRVKPSLQIGSTRINHEQRLEQEADLMGRKGVSIGQSQLQRPQMLETNQAANPIRTPVVQRVPYATVYSKSKTKKILDESEGRASPVNNQVGHPRQHAGKWAKAEAFAEQQSKTKSVFKNTDEQDKAIMSALNSVAGQAQLATLDVNPNVAQRIAISNVAVDAVDVMVVKAKKKKAPGVTDVKSWSYQSGTATQATVIVDSMGTGTPGDIHIQTAFPIF